MLCSEGGDAAVGSWLGGAAEDAVGGAPYYLAAAEGKAVAPGKLVAAFGEGETTVPMTFCGYISDADVMILARSTGSDMQLGAMDAETLSIPRSNLAPPPAVVSMYMSGQRSPMAESILKSAEAYWCAYMP